MKCHYCDEPAVVCIVRRVGEIPEDPKKVGTQSDLSALEVVRLCPAHRGS
jgi:hypothetical protein